MTAASTALTTRTAMAFSCVGHTYSHLFIPIFFILVPLALEQQLNLTHGETVALIVAGNMMFGFAAPVAGWLADRWSTVGMMAIFYLGTGIGMIMVGLSDTTFSIALWLAVTGTFASIYHPVGIAWLVRISDKTGTTLGINGIFGGLGPALAAAITGALVATIGWRAAYVVPGAVVFGTGILFVFCLLRGWIVENNKDRKPPPPPASRRDTIRVFVILAFTVICGGLIYQATGPALPKAFAVSFVDGEHGIALVSTLIGIVYVASGLMQVIGGRMADTYPPRRIYLWCFLLQVPVLVLAGMIDGGPFVAIAILMVCLNSSCLPAENMLIARYTPVHRRSLVYGLKFVLGIGVASLGVLMEGMLFDMTGDFFALFVTMAAIIGAGAVAIMMLPVEQPQAIAQPAE